MGDRITELTTTQSSRHPEIFIGENHIVYRMDERGTLKCIKGEIELDEKRKEILNVPGVGWMMGSAGFRKLSQWAGISVVNPADVIVDGVSQQNPYVVRDSVGNVISVHSRKMAIGRTPSGTWAFTDTTRCFSPLSYFMHELAKCPGTTLMATVAGKEKAATDPRYTFLETDPTIGLGLLIDLRNEDVIKKYNNHRSRMKYAEVVAQTMAERNAIKHHPSIPGDGIPEPKLGKLTVTVIGWVSTDEHIKRIAALAMDPNRNSDQIAQEGIDHRTVDTEDDIEDAELIEEVEKAQVETAEEVPATPSSPPVDLFDADKSAEIDKQIAAQDAARTSGGKKR